MPARKPDHLKAVSGTYRKDRRQPTTRTPAASVEKPPPCPRWLDKEARRLWRKMAPRLHELGLLDPLDANGLALACTCLATATRAAEELATDGLTATDPAHADRLRKHPAWQIFREAQDAYRQWAVKLGLDPTDRAKIHQPKPADEKPRGFAAL